jgi:hypothetical protein
MPPTIARYCTLESGLFARIRDIQLPSDAAKLAAKI